MIVEIDPAHPRIKRLRAVVSALERGEVVGYPTDTVYAVGCDSASKKAVQIIHRLKMEKSRAKLGPKGQRPLSLIFPDLSSIAEWAIVDDSAYRLLRKATPGPFTFVLRATRKVPRVMLTKQKTIGIRIPDAHVVVELARLLGRPLVTTSAARTSGEQIHDGRDLAEAYPASVGTVLDAGYLPGDPSTVIDLSSGPPVLIRQGKGLLTDIGLEL